MLAAQPVVSIDGGGTIMLGQQAHLSLTFSNDGDATGYAPYIDLIVPHNGADGAGAGNTPVTDGASFASASYLGQALAPLAVLEFDAAGPATPPPSHAMPPVCFAWSPRRIMARRRVTSWWCCSCPSGPSPRRRHLRW